MILVIAAKVVIISDFYGRRLKKYSGPSELNFGTRETKRKRAREKERELIEREGDLKRVCVGG